MQRRWITVKEAAEYLSIHPVTCRRLIAKDEIKATRIGKNVRVDLKALEQKMIEKIQNGT